MSNYKLTPKLKSVLRERKIKQLDLSIDSGVPCPYISRFDNTEDSFDISNLFSIAKALGLSMEELFDIEEIKKEGFNKDDIIIFCGEEFIVIEDFGDYGTVKENTEAGSVIENFEWEFEGDKRTLK